MPSSVDVTREIGLTVWLLEREPGKRETVLRAGHQPPKQSRPEAQRQCKIRFSGFLYSP